MPEQMMQKIKNSILPTWRVCFISALVMGLLSHLYKITNWLPNWDSLVFRYDSQDMLPLGRWFLGVVCAPSSFYDLPFVSGFLAIIYHALGAVCIVKMFDVKKNITAVLTGAFVATFPVVTSVMMYNYVSDGYALAFLLSSVAAMLLTKEKPCYIGSLILIALSAGIYQAYISVTIMLLLLSLIMELIYKKTEIKKILVKCGGFLLTGIFGVLLYYLILTFLLKITGTALLEYQGVNSALSFETINIAKSFYAVKESFFAYFFDFSKGISAFVLLNCIMALFGVAFYVYDTIKNKVGVLKSLILLLLVVLLPVGSSVLVFINSDIDHHNLMKMGFMVFYLFFIFQYEKAEMEGTKESSAKAWSILGITAIMIFNQMIIANVSYHKLHMAYEKSYGTLIRIADRIELTEGTENCEKILVIGAISGSEPYSSVLPPDITGTTDGYIIRKDDEVVGQSVLCSALNDYCGKIYELVSGEEKKEILEKIDMDSLENWPLKNSVLVVGDVLVIKLGD